MMPGKVSEGALEWERDGRHGFWGTGRFMGYPQKDSTAESDLGIEELRYGFPHWVSAGHFSRQNDVGRLAGAHGQGEEGWGSR